MTRWTDQIDNLKIDHLIHPEPTLPLRHAVQDLRTLAQVRPRKPALLLYNMQDIRLTPGTNKQRRSYRSGINLPICLGRSRSSSGNR